MSDQAVWMVCSNGVWKTDSLSTLPRRYSIVYMCMYLLLKVCSLWGMWLLYSSYTYISNATVAIISLWLPSSSLLPPLLSASSLSASSLSPSSLSPSSLSASSLSASSSAYSRLNPRYCMFHYYLFSVPTGRPGMKPGGFKYTSQACTNGEISTVIYWKVGQ